MIKKVINSLFFLIISFMIVSTSYAAEASIILEIVQKASETKYLENDQGNISKPIVDSYSETGELTIELKL